MIFKTGVRVVLLSAFLLIGIAQGVMGEDDVVAKVGGIPITVYELDRAAQKIMPMKFHGALSQEKVDEIRSQALDNLINQAYMVRYALSEEIAIDNKLVEEKMKPIRARYKSQKEFEEAAGDEGINAFRATIYRELLAEKAEEVAVKSRIQVSDEQVRKYYEDNKMTYMRPERYKASQILIKVDPGSNQEEREALKKRADDILARAKAGEDFYNLAYYNSDDRTKYVGGDLGYFHKGQTLKEFEDAVVALKPGEISDLVQTRFGYHVIKLVEVNESRLLSFEEVKDKIRQSLEKKKRDALYSDWMSSLKSKYQVQRLAD